MKYKLKTDRKIRGTLYAKAGDVVYACCGYDYGCANDDTRMLGFEHISVTLKEDGGYPFFTVPIAVLEEIK